jgi:3-deoxy-D-manno-octulosonic-acid transferase
MISGLLNKLGFWGNDIQERWKLHQNWVWLHAVSVGELNAIYPLIENIRLINPNLPIMISCTTEAGYNLAKNKTRNTDISVIFFPFDIPPILNNLFNIINLKLLIIAETEIWPNLLNICNRKNIPVVLVNARISDKSFRNYYLLKFYFKNIVSLYSKILTQSEDDTNKFIKLGAIKEKTKTLGNIKFASVSKSSSNGPSEAILNKDKKLTYITFASTHPGEEKIAIDVYKALRSDYSNLRLCIAPRHINRRKEICNLITNKDLNAILRTNNNPLLSNNDVFILDTIGELKHIYKDSKVTIIGGTFVKVGGHNILEPISESSYTIIGPYDYKIKDLSKKFKDADALTQVRDTSELILKIKEALENDSFRQEKINKGLNIIKENKNILEDFVNEIREFL